jgi:hypothetical protein
MRRFSQNRRNRAFSSAMDNISSFSAWADPKGGRPVHQVWGMRRNGAGIDQGICITSYAGQCRTVDQAFKIINRHGRSANLSNHFADLLAQAGLRERAPHHRSKGKGRSGQRASNSLSFHSLRHTAVSLLKDAGIPEGVVMELVGHDSKSMSAHYTHVGVEALEKAVAALPEI